MKFKQFLKIIYPNISVEEVVSKGAILFIFFSANIGMTLSLSIIHSRAEIPAFAGMTLSFWLVICMCKDCMCQNTK